MAWSARRRSRPCCSASACSSPACRGRRCSASSRLLLAISQIGAPLLILIWGAAAFWLFQQDRQAAAIFVVAVGIFVGLVDNVLKPWLIGFGVRMPMSLIILGVFGGFLSFGFLGLFIGPALLAVATTLLQAWRAAAVTGPPEAGN